MASRFRGIQGVALGVYSVLSAESMAVSAPEHARQGKRLQWKNVPEISASRI